MRSPTRWRARSSARIANRGTVTAAERTADGIVLDARAAMADLLGADAARRRLRPQHDRS